MLKSAGAHVASLAYNANLPPEQWEVLRNALERPVDWQMEQKYPRHNIDPFDVIKALPLCESPIEKIMLIGMMTMHSYVVPVVHDPMSGDKFPETALVITPQFNIARYRLDFLLTIQKPSGPWNFAVECDGIEFHGALEKRKADAERDAYLKYLGIKTVRYYGQTIKKLGHRCADEIAAIVNEELGEGLAA